MLDNHRPECHDQTGFPGVGETLAKRFISRSVLAAGVAMAFTLLTISRPASADWLPRIASVSQCSSMAAAQRINCHRTEMEKIWDTQNKVKELRELVRKIRGNVAEKGVRNPECGQSSQYESVRSRMSGGSCSTAYNKIRGAEIEVKRLECVGYFSWDSQIKTAKQNVKIYDGEYKNCFQLSLYAPDSSYAKIVTDHNIRSYARLKEVYSNIVTPYLRRQDREFLPAFRDHSNACNRALRELPQAQQSSLSCQPRRLESRG